jgi:hypothetical protein
VDVNEWQEAGTCVVLMGCKTANVAGDMIANFNTLKKADFGRIFTG